MRFTKENTQPTQTRGTTRFSRLALAAALALGTPAAFSKPAFAQQAENGFSGNAAREARDAVSNFAYIESLGRRPVLGRGETMTRETAHQTALRLQENGFAPGSTSAVLEEVLSYLGEQRPGGQLQHDLASAPRVLGEPGRVNITDRVEALQGGDQLPEGVTVEVRYNGVNSQRLMGGMTYGDGNGGVTFDARNRLPGLNVGTSRILTTQGLEIRVTERTPQGNVVREYVYFDEDCGNVAPYGAEQQPVMQAVEASPCMDFVITDLPPGMEVLRFEVVATKDGGQMSAEDAADIQTCLRETEDLGNLISRNCDDCTTRQFRDQLDALLIRNLPRGVAIRLHPTHSISMSRVDAEGRYHIRIPRQDERVNADNSLINEVLCFSKKDADGRLLYRSNAFVVEDENIRGKRIEENAAQDLPIQWFDASGRPQQLTRSGEFRRAR
jgi:hypothetical protein